MLAKTSEAAALVKTMVLVTLSIDGMTCEVMQILGHTPQFTTNPSQSAPSSLTRHHKKYSFQHCVKTATNALVAAGGDGAKVQVQLDPGK